MFNNRKYNQFDRRHVRINQEIRVPQVRLIDETGKQIGIIATSRAQEIARERGLDLLEVSPQAKPPVCKVIDYGKYRYQKAKQEQKARKKQKKTGIKGIRLSVRIGQHDFEFKARQAEKFLAQGHKIRVELILRGREHAHTDLALAEIRKFQANLKHPIKVEQSPRKLGNSVTAIFSSNQN